MSGGSLSEAVALINRYMDDGYTDGLPVIPPTQEAVDAMVAASGRPGDEVLGALPPANGTCTIQTLAINAVMAGCLPAYMPVVVTALEAMLDPLFNLVSPATTTKGVAPLMIINGPVRQKLGINCKGNLFGHGFRANATIGRAIRLAMINVGGAKSIVLDKSTFGHPGKYTYVIGEDEEGSPWTPLHVQEGFKPEDSTVTVFPSEGVHAVNNHHASAGAKGILFAIADALSPLQAGGGSEGADAVVIIGGEHRATLAAEGYTKDQIREFIFTHARRRAWEYRQVGDERFSADDDRWIQVFGRPDKIHIIAGGAGAGRFSAVIPGFSMQKFSKWQIRRIPV